MANLRIRMTPQFPSNVDGNGGIVVNKTNGHWTIEPQWGDLALIDSALDITDKQVWVYDDVTGVYNRARLPLVFGGTVRYDEVQTLTDEQKEQVRDNVGAESATGVSSYSALLALTGLIANERVYLTQYDAGVPDVGGGYYKVISTSGGGFYGLATITNGGSGYTDGNLIVVNLTGGGGTGASVFAYVEGGAVTRIEWRTAGTGYTSAPSFNWSALTGAGTPGNITFSLADGGVYVRTTSGALLAREEYLEAGLVRPEWWGARGDTFGDDGVPFNLMFSYLRTFARFTTATHPVAQLRGRAVYNIQSPINVTKFRTKRLKIYGNGSVLNIVIAGGVGLDFTNSQNVSWDNLTMRGDFTSTPKYGVVLAVQGSETSAWNDFSDAEFYGFFTDAMVYNMGSEFNTWNKASMANSWTGGKALILDAANSKGWSSPFAPSTATPNSFKSLYGVRFESSRFVAVNTTEVIELAGPPIKLTFKQAYVAAFGGAAFGISANNITSIPFTQIEIDYQAEPTSMTSGIRFYTDAGQIVMNEFKYADSVYDYSTSVFQNAGAGVVQLRDVDIFLGATTATGVGVFASGGNISLDGRVHIGSALPAQSNLSGLSSFQGSLYTRATEAQITFPPAYGLWLQTVAANPKYVASGANLLLPLRITLGDTQIREYTADPEGNLTAPPGSVVLRKSGNGNNSTLYLKITGVGNTGWRAVPSDIAALINTSANKATPVDADQLALVDSAASNSLKNLTWANVKTTLGSVFSPLRPAPVQTVDTTNPTTASPTYVTTGVSATITPTLGARIRVSVTGGVGSDTASALTNFTLFRGATELTPAGTTGFAANRCNANASLDSFQIDFVDSPNTASATTYTLYWKTTPGNAFLGRRGADATIDIPTTITLQEVA